MEDFLNNNHNIILSAAAVLFTAIVLGLIGLFWLHNADKEIDVNKLHHNDYIGEKL